MPEDLIANNKPATEIAVFEENTEGHDVIVGDVHGEVSILASIVKDLKSNDRLFIVGDLVDRGEDSLKVMRFINSYNQESGKQRIIPIKGNHEVLLERYIKTLQHPDDFTFVERMEIKDNYFYNGGEWTQKLKASELEELRLLLLPLPIIIHVKAVNDNDKFNIVHADMPISDKTLLEKIASNDLTLTDDQKFYAVWARNNGEIPTTDNGRTATSIPAYCGHTILEGVRSKTNHINLDFGSYDTHHIGVANHSTRKCVTYTTQYDLDREVVKILGRVNAQLQTLPAATDRQIADNFKNKIGIRRNDVQEFIENPFGNKKIKDDEASAKVQAIIKDIEKNDAEHDAFQAPSNPESKPIDLNTLSIPMDDEPQQHIEKSVVANYSNFQPLNEDSDDNIEVESIAEIKARFSSQGGAIAKALSSIEDCEKFINKLRDKDLTKTKKGQGDDWKEQKIALTMSAIGLLANFIKDYAEAEKGTKSRISSSVSLVDQLKTIKEKIAKIPHAGPVSSIFSKKSGAEKNIDKVFKSAQEISKAEYKPDEKPVYKR
jgi:hypothetical protein